MSVDIIRFSVFAGHRAKSGSSPALCRCAADGDNGDYKTTKDYKDSIQKDVNTKSDRTNQHSGQDNLCYRDDGCEQANEGEQIEGKDNEA